MSVDPSTIKAKKSMALFCSCYELITAHTIINTLGTACVIQVNKFVFHTDTSKIITFIV